jgi:hypothetical protein
VADVNVRILTRLTGETRVYDIIDFISFDTVEEWEVWPQGPRLQGEDGGKAGARGNDKIIE